MSIQTALRCNYISIKSNAFSLIEVMVTLAIMAILASLLLPVIGKARESARYTAWQAMNNSMRADPRLALYYDFNRQAGDELSAGGEPIVENKSTGDPMGLVASEASSNGAQDPELRYGVLKDSHPNNDSKGALPTFEDNKSRFRGKQTMRFYGKSGAENKTAKEGSYIRPDYWAGIVEKGEFQIAMWMKIKPHCQWQKPLSWGDWNTSNKVGELFAFGSDRYNNGINHFRINTDGNAAKNFDKQRIDVFDDQWHLVMLRLRAPYSSGGQFSDPTIPELNDIEVSIDGGAFRKTSDSAKYALETRVTELLIGSKADNSQDYIQGLVDELAIWQEPLDDLEVKKYYRVGAPMGHAPAQWYNP